MAMMLAAADLGIGSGHSAVGDQDACRRILGSPSDHECAYMIALGYPADRPLKPVAKLDRRPFDEVVHRGGWSLAPRCVARRKALSSRLTEIQLR
jgi:nitroreductase